ncbi:MAG TPA: hypothetical protein PLZ51_18800, partial [Aggregatilineales bacterium]|nr:hypothetical protein [Aggregatilineales bacterium]
MCDGEDLQLTISGGDAPFMIDVTAIVPVSTTGNPIGVYSFDGPDTFDVTVTEESGDSQTASLTGITCNASVVPVAPVVLSVALSPDATALGCDITAYIDVTTDNTYCRILMNNGKVVNYSGAVPKDLINLGVILAVDVYRLQGGQSITDFGGYSRVCLAGQGRLFYL